MNLFIRSTSEILKGSIKALRTFPASISSALAFTIVTIIRIHLDWPQQEAYNFLFNCLHWSFALGAIFSLAMITGAKSFINKKKVLLFANLIGAVAVILTFLALYFFSQTYSIGARYTIISDLAASRVGIALLVSFITFIVITSYPKDQSDFSRSLFMTQKAFFIAVVYGLIILAGTSGVARAVQALLYNGMSEKVYMYIGAISSFMAFTIFVGYFPDFEKGRVDERREITQKQPRFIQILFEYIMIPILLALTVVLLLWVGRTVLSGMKVSFFQLSGIAIAYTTYGIWLHIMVTHYNTGLAKFYRRIYPLAALLILAFEAWALVIQLQRFGLKTAEYLFIVTWAIALIAAVLLLIRQAKAHLLIAALTCGIAIIAVMPIINYHQLPITAQIHRLEKLLVNEEILRGDQLFPATSEPELAVRESITDAVNFLMYAQGANLPAWFDKDLGDSNIFKTKLGFEQAWPKPEKILGQNTDSLFTVLMLKPEAIDIIDYRWAVDMQQLLEQQKGQSNITLNGEKGTYRIEYDIDMNTGIPNLRIKTGDRMLLQENFDSYIDRISKAYPPNQGQPIQAGLKDMSVQIKTPELTLLIVFRNIEIRLNPREDRINYWVNLGSIYIKENL